MNHHTAWWHPDAGSQIERHREIREGQITGQTALILLELRELVIDQFERGPFVGTPAQVAQQIDDFVQNDGSDGFIIGSHLVPWGLDEFVDRVVPVLQERGSVRAEYMGTTLRDNLGLPPLPRSSGRQSDRTTAAV